MDILTLLITALGAVALFVLGYAAGKRSGTLPGVDPGELKALRQELESSKVENARLQERLTLEQQHRHEEVKKQEDRAKQLLEQMENLSNRILKQQSLEFQSQSKKELDQILTPFREKLDHFRKEVAEKHESQTKTQGELQGMLSQLRKETMGIGEEARALTKALKGDSKAQGDWGETVLEMILENSGLQKGVEYQTQESITTEEGSRLRPDVVVRLPENKVIVIDSKVSLSAYAQYEAEEDPAQKKIQLKRHLESLRGHIKELSAKNYEQIHGIKSPDFVFLFVALEPAFLLAMKEDPTLYDEAYRQRIILVSRTYLMAALKTVASIWKVERQNKNAEAIAHEAGLMLDKFTAFIKDMETLGQRLDQAQSSFRSAQKKLSQGHGNLIGKARKLQDLGASGKKELPESLLPLEAEEPEPEEEPEEEQ